MKHTTHMDDVLTILDRIYPTIPMHEVHATSPFRLLVAIILSQRAKDTVTVPLTKKLFERVTTPEDLVALPLLELESIIRPIGFYHSKAKSLHDLAKVLIAHHQGTVPQTEAELLALPRVGRKTANILLTQFFHTPQIAVDTHVHRITNLLGWIHTKTPEQTEKELTKLIPKKWHTMVNRVFVMHGQHICLPRQPHCTHCPILLYCKRVGLPPLAT